MMSPFYIAFNVLYQFASLLILWVFNKDLNEEFIPPGFFPKYGLDGKATKLSNFVFFLWKFFILIGEAVILVAIVTIINQLILRATVSSKKRRVFAGQTVRTNIIINFCYVIILMWGHFMAGLW